MLMLKLSLQYLPPNGAEWLLTLRFYFKEATLPRGFFSKLKNWDWINIC